MLLLGGPTSISELTQKPRPPALQSIRRGVTMPSLFDDITPAGPGSDSRGELDENYRERMQAKMASTHKAAMPSVNEDELDALENLFHGADIDIGDGVVDFTEFKGVMELLGKTTGKRYNALQLRGLFHMADIDGSGTIDFNEFIHAQRRMKKNFGTAKAATYMSMAMQKQRESTNRAGQLSLS